MGKARWEGAEARVKRLEEELGRLRLAVQEADKARGQEKEHARRQGEARLEAVNKDRERSVAEARAKGEAVEAALRQRHGEEMKALEERMQVVRRGQWPSLLTLTFGSHH
jgi:hypothetical protein